MNVLARVMRAAWDEANKPVTYAKGEEFEHYTRERLFPKEAYDLLQKTHSYIDNKGDFIASSKEPDFRFKSKYSCTEFYVEAKFRSKYHDGGLEWCKDFQLKRYQEIDNAVPVLIAIGLGGHPAEPEKVFLIPMKHIKFIKLYPSFLSKYEVPPGHSISANHLKNIL
jgi:hypothetical protein